MSNHVLIVGYGSIGKRHAGLVNEAGRVVSLVTSQSIAEFDCYSSIEAAMAEKKYDLVVVANPTSQHYDSLMMLMKSGFSGKVLLEKPMFLQPVTLPSTVCFDVFVAYNLRFHPLLLKLKSILDAQKLISFTAYVGQYLPTWRERDYRECSSAHQSQGGGVLNDLSHELDYALWICGGVSSVTALGGHFSDLEIDTDDSFSILMRCEHCPSVSLQLNYLDRMPRREILVNTTSHTYHLDFLRGTLIEDGDVIQQCENGFAMTYAAQLTAFLNDESDKLCHQDAGLAVVQLTQLIREGSECQRWVTV